MHCAGQVKPFLHEYSPLGNRIYPPAEMAEASYPNQNYMFDKEDVS
jgi:hypothetical protein